MNTVEQCVCANRSQCKNHFLVKHYDLKANKECLDYGHIFSSLTVTNTMTIAHPVNLKNNTEFAL